MTKYKLPVITGFSVPETLEPDKVLRLFANSPRSSDINVRDTAGWINQDESDALASLTVGIAGCGGMGGQLGLTLIRAGVGTIKYADVEEFDTSNINRQAAAFGHTVGKSKLAETVRLARSIRDDTVIEGFPMGICERSVGDFVKGCDLIIAEIELFVLDEMIRLHQVARRHDIPVLDGLVVGWGTNLFLYDHQQHAYTIEQMLGWGDLPESEVLPAVQKAMADQSKAGKQDMVNRILNAYVPNLPNYVTDVPEQETVLQNLLKGKAPIVAATPPFATGYAGVNAMLLLLEKVGLQKRDRAPLPTTPGFMSTDVFQHTTARIERTKVEKKNWF